MSTYISISQSHIVGLLLIFEIELGVGDVVLGVVGLAWTDGLDVLGWYAAPDFACRDLRVLEHEGTCAPAATMAPSPTSQPSSRVEPMPMRV